MYKAYKDRFEFFLVYIREAHPVDGKVSPKNTKEGIKVTTAKTEEERAAQGKTCADKLALSMPILVDGMDDEVSKAWAGWPDRPYLVGADGKVAYKGKQAGEFKAADLESELKKYLAAHPGEDEGR
ncbi:MAG: hypothetical protein HYY18_07290 [Planctomycetes bacterium]|nr:hypothetical protein [Planctomycetota bacterium]